MVTTAGSGSDDLWFDDVYSLDIGSWQWSKVDPKGGVAPSPRDYTSISVIADKVGWCTYCKHSSLLLLTYLSTQCCLVVSVAQVVESSVLQTSIMWISPKVDQLSNTGGLVARHDVCAHAGDFEWHSVTVKEPVLPARYAHSAFFYKGKVKRLLHALCKE